MKKLLSVILVICSLLGGNAYSNEIPDYIDDINENIKKYGWKIDDSYFMNNKNNGNFIEIVTMSNKGWIIKCGIFYVFEKIQRVTCGAP